MVNASETDLLNLIFNNVAWANIGNAGGLQPSGAAGNLYIALHTGDPGAAGNQSTSESAYTGYTRIGVVRSAVGWTVAGATVSNTAAVAFPTCGVTGSTVTYFSIGTLSAGAGEIIVRAALTTPLTITTSMVPTFNAGQLTATAS
jgi:hypothetical protein